MEHIEKYPYTAMFTGFFVSFCLFAYCLFAVKLIIILVCAVAFTILSIVAVRRGMKIRRGALLLVSAVIISGIYSAAVFDVYLAEFDKYNDVGDRVTAEITDCEYSLSYISRYTAKIVESDKLSRGTRILLECSEAGLKRGTVLSGKLKYYPLSSLETGGFDAERYYRSDGIMLFAAADELAVIEERISFSFSYVFTSVREKLSSLILAHTEKEAGGLASAVLLGNRKGLPDTAERDFRRLGISHLLVVSGMHFAIIMSFTEYFLRRMKMRAKLRASLNIVLILILMGIMGFTPSVVRAGIMYIIAQFSKIVFKRANTFNSFSLSGTLIMIFNPFAALDCGLQLSYVATLSCIIYSSEKGYLKLFRGRSADKKTVRTKFISNFLSTIRETVLITVFVTFATLPLTWLYFGEISLAAIPANIVFVPLITLLMYISGVYLILYPIRIFIIPCAFLIDKVSELIFLLSRAFSGIHHIMLPVNYTFTVFFLIPISAFILFIPFASAKMKKKLVLGAVSAFALFAITIGTAGFLDRSNVYYTYINNKKNDGFILKTENNILICDMSAGGFSYFRNLTEKAKDFHACEIDTLLLTHYHSKHVQLLSRLCEREILARVVLPCPVNEKEEEIYLSLTEMADFYGTEVVTVENGETFEFGSTYITVYERKYLSRSTHPITAVSVAVGEDDITLVSCSFNQSFDEVKEKAENSEYIIFGNHSPVYKKKISFPFENVKEAVIGEESLDFFDAASAEKLNLITHTESADEYDLKFRIG